LQAPNEITKLKSQDLKNKTQISRLRSSTAIAFGGGSEALAGEAISRTKK
jgi:hypothetical protein